MLIVCFQLSACGAELAHGWDGSGAELAPERDRCGKLDVRLPSWSPLYLFRWKSDYASKSSFLAQCWVLSASFQSPTFQSREFVQWSFNQLEIGRRAGHLAVAVSGGLDNLCQSTNFSPAYNLTDPLLLFFDSESSRSSLWTVASALTSTRMSESSTEFAFNDLSASLNLDYYNHPFKRKPLFGHVSWGNLATTAITHGSTAIHLQRWIVEIVSWTKINIPQISARMEES